MKLRLIFAAASRATNGRLLAAQNSNHHCIPGGEHGYVFVDGDRLKKYPPIRRIFLVDAACHCYTTTLPANKNILHPLIDGLS
jgi:hypothetical protein